MPDRTVLLTGFGAFPGVDDNPSARVALDLHDSVGDGWRVHAAVLPVAWKRAHDEVADLVARLKPNLLVHLGVATDSAVVRLETRAVNVLHFRVADVDGAQPTAGEVIPLAPLLLESTVDLSRLAAHARLSGLEVALSDDAGRYVCNATYFASLHAFPDIPVLFIHIPPVSETWPMARLTLTVSGILHLLLA